MEAPVVQTEQANLLSAEARTEEANLLLAKQSEAEEASAAVNTKNKGGGADQPEVAIANLRAQDEPAKPYVSSDHLNHAVGIEPAGGIEEKAALPAGTEAREPPPKWGPNPDQRWTTDEVARWGVHFDELDYDSEHTPSAGERKAVNIMLNANEIPPEQWNQYTMSSGEYKYPVKIADLKARDALVEALQMSAGLGLPAGSVLTVLALCLADGFLCDNTAESSGSTYPAGEPARR